MKQQVCAVIRAGAPLEMAARYIGCHARTIHCATQADLEFAQRLARAFASQEIEQVHALVSHSKNRWRAAAWYLERRRRGYRRVNHRHVDPDRQPSPGSSATRCSSSSTIPQSATSCFS